MDHAIAGTIRSTLALITLAAVTAHTSRCDDAAAAPIVETWQTAIRRMSLPAPALPLQRDDCVPRLLRAFQSNDVVKALIVLPSVADEFYLFQRAAPALNLPAADLLEAIIALTNRTSLRITFRASFLLLHTSRDVVTPSVTAAANDTMRRLARRSASPRVLWIDQHWEEVQPALARAIGRRVLPDAKSQDAWHFARHNVAGWNLTPPELLDAVSLTGGTTITVERRRIVVRGR